MGKNNIIFLGEKRWFPMFNPFWFFEEKKLSFFVNMTGQVFAIMTDIVFFRQYVGSPLWRILWFDSVTRPLT